MARTIRFHLDENCHPAIAEGLRRRGVDVTTTPEVGLLQASDETQIAYALPLGRVIFTQDRDFLRLHAASVPHAGIAYCDKDTKSIGEIITRMRTPCSWYGSAWKSPHRDGRILESDPCFLLANSLHLERTEA